MKNFVEDPSTRTITRLTGERDRARQDLDCGCGVSECRNARMICAQCEHRRSVLEISALHEERDEALKALRLCARVVSGNAMSKKELIAALEAARAVLKNHGCAVCFRDGPLVDGECPDCRH